MGDIKLVTDIMPDLLPMRGRSDGPHVSSAIHRMCLAAKVYPDSEIDNSARIRMEFGNSFERALASRLSLDDPDRYVEPGEVERDGIFGTPDLVDVIDWAVVEIKLTWMSARHDPESEKFWRYWTQIKSYCHMTNMNLGRLHVLFVNGDYRDNSPQYKVFEQRFSPLELIENWEMIKSRSFL